MAVGFPLGPLPEAIRSLLVETVDLSDKAGWNYLQALPVKRSVRKTLLRSKWMVHLFAGKKGSTSVELKALETGDVAYLEVDILKSKAYDLRGRSSVYKALLWAALRGQVEGILGGPPRNAGEASQELVMKQMFLWMVAKHAALDLHGRNPFFAMELPSLHPFWKQER